MFRPFSEAKLCFLEDVREKKKAALGVHSKTGKNGYTGKILFPTDFMSRKEKYNHRKAGKIMTSNIFDQILTVNEFENLETYEKKNRLAYWRNKFSNKEIMGAMGISNKRYYDIVGELELPKAPRSEAQIRKPNRKAKAVAAIGAPQQPNFGLQSELELEPSQVQEIMVNGLHLVYNGTYGSEQILKQLLKFGALLEGEENQFYVEIKMVEKVANK